MQAFTTVTGRAAALPAANIDTDVIMPKQFLKGVDRSGLGAGAFHDLRFEANGQPRPEFVLNRGDWRDARFLVVGPNFGCGSSREHAVWGLLQLGIRGLIGTSFAGIFFDNCARNGLLALTLGAQDVARMLACAADPPRSMTTIDLPAQRITMDCIEVDFDMPADRKDALVQGLDAIGTTLAYRDEIIAFQRAHLETNPWLA
jgi:3-isopropylmalate/(R)-2-methylmalate dehydratase small subunit